MASSIDPSKKITLITGGNAGIGFEIASQLLHNPSTHILLGARSAERGNAAVADLRSRNLPGTVEVLPLDVSSEESIKAAAESVRERFGHLDNLVNNAGIMRYPGTFAEQMREFFAVNTLGPALMGEYFNALLLKAEGTARVVHVTSGAGSIGMRLDPDPSRPGANIVAVPYRVSKAGQNMVFATQTYELRGTNVKVFLYGPGPTQSRHNTIKEFKTTAEGAKPAVEMIEGKRDEDVGKYIEYGFDHMSW